MKKILIVLLIGILFSLNVYAFFINWFDDIDSLAEKAESIIIAECVSIITKEVPVDGPTKLKVNVISALKGTEEKGIIEISSFYRLEVGKKYLLSSHNKERIFYGEFSAVLLDEYFDLSLLEHKTLKEKLLFIFQRRLNTINSDIKSLDFEKGRLDKLLKNKTPNH